ncbi:hypothetical protein HWD96_04575 [Pseudomonas putida]|uniref:hypothetical protein n=1 Tax=Pseudomonas putida TaxID=303 RepID=UPI001F527CF4|nr:hypothetical protein [Pseudomonas putida]MCI1021497.1 hypothetical protein [Pseudomonas putida]
MLAIALFDPLRDYYHRRQAALLDRQAQGVQLKAGVPVGFCGKKSEPILFPISCCA